MKIVLMSKCDATGVAKGGAMMKSYHETCGSSNIVLTKSRDPRLMSFCRHCKRHIENQEIVEVDNRISVIIYKGKAYTYGRECK